MRRSETQRMRVVARAGDAACAHSNAFFAAGSLSTRLEVGQNRFTFKNTNVAKHAEPFRNLNVHLVADGRSTGRAWAGCGG